MSNQTRSRLEYLKKHNLLDKHNASASSSNNLLVVGDFEVRKEGNLIFIKNSSGESGGFDPVLFEKCISNFFDSNF
jgi:hypothetical protein